MNNPESRHGIRPASAKTATRAEYLIKARRHPGAGPRTLLQLCLSALAFALCATAIAQQKPLTGRMLGNQPPSSHTAPPAPSQSTPTQPAPLPSPTRPATTYPTHGGQPAPREPMPAYTNMSTLGPQPTEDDTESRDAVFGVPIGGTTEGLLRMQASNRAAGPARPMLGDEATAAYKRYIDSFKHPIPEFFQTKVESGSDSSGSSSGR